MVIPGYPRIEQSTFSSYYSCKLFVSWEWEVIIFLCWNFKLQTSPAAGSMDGITFPTVPIGSINEWIQYQTKVLKGDTNQNCHNWRLNVAFDVLEIPVLNHISKMKKWIQIFFGTNVHVVFLLRMLSLGHVAMDQEKRGSLVAQWGTLFQTTVVDSYFLWIFTPQIYGKWSQLQHLQLVNPTFFLHKSCNHRYHSGETCLLHFRLKPWSSTIIELLEMENPSIFHVRKPLVLLCLVTL